MRARPSWLRGHRLALLLMLLAGLAIRLLLWIGTAETQLQISDEKIYAQLAHNLVLGNGFSWYEGAPTSSRPPLFPFLLAGVWSLTGAPDYQAARLAQTLVALLTVGLIYRLGAAWFDERVGTLAAGAYFLYPTLVGHSSLLLSESLFNALFCAVALLFTLTLESRRPLHAFLTGVALAAAALTRTIAWPFAPPLAALLFLCVPGSRRRRLGAGSLLLLGFLLTLAPWSVRSSRLQGEFRLIDTLGGINLYNGNHEHTVDDRAWDPGADHWMDDLLARHPDARAWTEARRENWAKREAVRYMASHPGRTLRRAAIKFADLWGLERTFAAAWQQDLYDPPSWFRVLALATILVAYVLVASLGVLGLYLTPPARACHLAFSLCFVALVVVLHSLLFGHPRYHLPLVPFLTLHATAFATRRGWRLLASPTPAAWLACASVLLLLVIWGADLSRTSYSDLLPLLRGS